MPDRHSAPLQHSAVSAAGIVLWRARLYLFADRISITGWAGLRRYRREIPLDDVAEVRVPAPQRLEIRLRGAEVLVLSVADAEGWQEAIVAHRDVQIPPKPVSP